MIPKISPTHYFRLSNGQIIKHIDELPDSIERMPQHVFSQYVDEHKDDFARWIYDVFRFKDLSQMLGKIKSKQEYSRMLRAFLYNKKNQKTMMANAQETVQIKDPEPAAAQPQKQAHQQKYEWHGQKEPKEPEQKAEAKNPEPEIKPAQNTAQKVVIKQKPVANNAAKENTTNADKYFEDHPVLVSQMVEIKKKSLEKDEIAKISYSDSEAPEKVLDMFKDAYTKAYEKLVFLRKNGFDTKIVQLMLFRIPSRIKIYEAAQEKKEAIQITRLLNEAIEELNTINE